MFGAGALKNDEGQVLDTTGKFWLAAEGFVDFVQFLVEGAGLFKIQFLARLFANCLVLRAERISFCFEELDQAADFYVVFLLGATGEAGREAHFHFGVDTAGERGIAANLDLAAADFEEVEDALGESVSGFAGGERAVVRAPGRRAARVDWNASSGITTGISVAKIDFQDGGRAKAHHSATFFREEPFGMLIVGEGLFESGGGNAVMNSFGEVAEIEALAGRIERTEEALQASAQILRFDEIWLGFGIVASDQTNCRKWR